MELFQAAVDKEISNVTRELSMPRRRIYMYLYRYKIIITVPRRILLANILSFIKQWIKLICVNLENDNRNWEFSIF